MIYMAKKPSLGKKTVILQDTSEIGFIMTDDSTDWDNYLDVETGKVVHDLIGGRADDYENDEEAMDALALDGLDIDEEDFKQHEQIEKDRGTRYLEIPKVESWESYQDMKDFIETIDNAHVQELLAVAIDGSGAFHRFNDVMSRYPNILEKWFAFKKIKEESRVKEWLEGHGYSVIFQH